MLFRSFRFPSIVGPFTVVDLRARLSQAVVDVTSWQNLKAAREGVTAAERTAEDARDLVVLAVGGTYLQVVAAEARVQSAEAQLRTAEALHRQTAERKAAGLVAQGAVPAGPVGRLPAVPARHPVRRRKCSHRASGCDRLPLVVQAAGSSRPDGRMRSGRAPLRPPHPLGRG